jgi:predicted RNA-binding Zn-ribbon protein involved in translation (DUF1610 family)
MSDRSDAAEANRLYWDTDTSVAEIAAKLDLSRRALYEAVEPAATGSACPECGQELRYENRSARRSGQATCQGCGAVEPVENAPMGDAVSPGLSVVQGDARSDGRVFANEPDIRHRAVLLGGAAIAGVAIGTMAALIAMRRD